MIYLSIQSTVTALGIFEHRLRKRCAAQASLLQDSLRKPKRTNRASSKYCKTLFFVIFQSTVCVYEGKSIFVMALVVCSICFHELSNQLIN